MQWRIFGFFKAITQKAEKTIISAHKKRDNIPFTSMVNKAARNNYCHQASQDIKHSYILEKQLKQAYEVTSGPSVYQPHSNRRNKNRLNLIAKKPAGVYTNLGHRYNKYSW